jgi:hypothetical protein
MKRLLRWLTSPYQRVQNQISADHIEGLCNMLEYWVQDETTHPHYQRHMESIEYGRKRARRLRDA